MFLFQLVSQFGLIYYLSIKFSEISQPLINDHPSLATVFVLHLGWSLMRGFTVLSHPPYQGLNIIQLQVNPP